MIFPLVWEALFSVSWMVIALRDDKRHFTLTLYLMFFFYLGLLIRYRRDFSIRVFLKQFTQWRAFVLPVVLTAAGVALAHALSEFAGAEYFAGSVKIVLPLAYSSNVLETILFAATVMVLQPVAGELFFRGGLIRPDDGRLAVLMALLGICLEAASRSITPLGILETALIALPLVISYCVTKNIYVPLFVHLIFNIIVNIPDVVYDFMRLALA